MSPISSILRMIVGLAILALTYSTYHKSFANFHEGDKLQLFGAETGASAGQLTLAFAVIGIIGIGLFLLGITGLLKARK